MTSYRIWIPSRQTYIRMYEMNCEQYRNVLKTLEDDIDFEFAINQLIVSNQCDKSTNLQSLTIIDKFTIILQLKIHSCNSKLNLTRVCDKCDTKTDFSMDLNVIIDSLAVGIDRSFEEVFNFSSMTVICDIPCINFNEDFSYDKTAYDSLIDDYMYSFIKSIKLNDNFIDFNEMLRSDKLKICENIPFEIMTRVKIDYIDSIHKIFQDLLIVSVPCNNTLCKDSIVMNFNVNNMTDILKILFRDTSSINMLGQYAGISSNYHLDYNFYKNICPAELDTMYNMISQSKKSSENENLTHHDVDLFENYNSTGKVELPSEFE